MYNKGISPSSISYYTVFFLQLFFFPGLFSYAFTYFPTFTVKVTVGFAWGCLFVWLNPAFTIESLSGLKSCSTSWRGFPDSPIAWDCFTNVDRISNFIQVLHIIRIKRQQQWGARNATLINCFLAILLMWRAWQNDCYLMLSTFAILVIIMPLSFHNKSLQLIFIL